jgi:hypothetical protein
MGSDPRQWEFVRKRIETTSDPYEREDLLIALACSDNLNTLER